jgi:hypothetical protein
MCLEKYALDLSYFRKVVKANPDLSDVRIGRGFRWVFG